MSCSKEKSIYTKTGQQPWKSHFTAPQTDHWFWEVKYFKYYCIIGLIYILYLCVTLTYNLHYMDPFILICFNIDDSLRNLWFVESVHSPLTSLLQSSNLKKGNTIEFVTLCLKNFKNKWKLLSVEDNYLTHIHKCPESKPYCTGTITALHQWNTPIFHCLHKTAWTLF